MSFSYQHRLLSADEMQAVDQRADDQGLDTYRLMEAAGTAVADCVKTNFSLADQVVVIAGPGNNGGDGIVAATQLLAANYQVFVILLGQTRNNSDASRALAHWSGPIETLDIQQDTIPETVLAAVANADIVIDALFGAGLSREPSAASKLMIKAINASKASVVAVDVPSGLDGNTNFAYDTAVQANHTVSFFLAKPVHYLFPGRQLCGHLSIAQIGLNQDQLAHDAIPCYLNVPAGFASALPEFDDQHHKFQRGHVLVRSGAIDSTGASRLSATAAIYSGTGLVTLACDSEALPIHAAHLTAVMLKRIDNSEQWSDALRDDRINTVLIGPGNGVNKATSQSVIDALRANKACVLDADALSCWADIDDLQQFRKLCLASTKPVVVTPHAGEFSRLFGHLFEGRHLSKLHQAKLAADWLGVVVIYKGADTVIATPGGKACINNHAPAWLATAGAGDVLAGLVASLIAQGMPVFEASCAAVWIHGNTAYTLGYPLCAETLATEVGKELGRFYQPH